ncbi:MAG: penicillin acylase family protein [Bacteroidetes bacterium]|nr:penicillin acylase family protein [Bacteroidota bacterium]MBS1973145.1 penicillin acylase family protein [Bacteroidota bacterium]
MKQLLLLLIPFSVFGQDSVPKALAGWQQQALKVTIARDTWGIPHVYGKTDADAVFGLMYAECEENFERVERNYLEVMGRLAEVDGPSKMYDDLQMQLIYDSVAAKKDYENSPGWFKKLLNAFADGVNYYLYKHPGVHAQVLKHFEPWFALMYTDGSISATETGGLTIQDVKNLYPLEAVPASVADNLKKNNDRELLAGSNGFAFAPSRTTSGNPILYINPHVTFYFRIEAQMASDEGLNAYGAATWGQFFIYQGFNEHCGWMHTSSYADVADLYEEKITRKRDSFYSEYDGRLLPVRKKQIVLRYKKSDGIAAVPLVVYYTNHGPVMGSRHGKWLSLREHNRSYESLLQSWLRTKANGFNEFKKVMGLRANNSNNTVFADDKGNIAYWHGNFMPRRNPKFNYTLPLDGSTSATDWKGLHALDETIHIYNPASGYIANCNSTPFTASGKSSPKKQDYPAYMAMDGQNGRGLNAIRLFDNGKKFSLEQVMAAGYDHYLSVFAILIPSLIDGYKKTDDSDTIKKQVAAAVQALQSWDYYSSVNSIATTIAVEWGNLMALQVSKLSEEEEETDQVELFKLLAKKTGAKEQLHLLSEALRQLQSKYGDWRIAWGDINRFQRNTGKLRETFSDGLPSLPVAMTSSKWGSLPAFESKSFNGTKKSYGISGNSFIAAVEFGKKVVAKTISTGGESFDPHSKHFTDQAEMFVEGKFKNIFFYKHDVMQHVEKEYHPGEE